MVFLPKSGKWHFAPSRFRLATRRPESSRAPPTFRRWAAVPNDRCARHALSGKFGNMPLICKLQTASRWLFMPSRIEE